MHASVMAWVPTALAAGEVAGKLVIEVGSYDVNGSARPYIESLGPESYAGIDMQPGPRVDLVMDAADMPARLGKDCADIVAAFEMLEHAQDWQAAMAGMIRALTPGGLLVLTTRGPGFPYHGYPDDHWRFTVEAMGEIMTAAGMDILDLQADPDTFSPGVFVKARKPDGWKQPRDMRKAWGDIAGVTVMTG